MSKADNRGGIRVEIARNDGGHLAIEDADTLALRFFTTDISSAAADSYDECAHRTDPTGPFGEEDITPIRTGMRLARLDRATWPWLINDSPRGFLRAIDPAWDLVELDDRSWPNVREAMQQALYEFMGSGRGGAVATKFLHYKRPRLFPILDSAVLANIGYSIPEPTTSKNPATVERSRRRRADVGVAICSRLRKHSIENISSLRTIQILLRDQGKERSLWILDALLWSVHPASEPSHWGTLRWSGDLV
jgi:Family of unknown function (DUF6308)